MEGQKGAAGAEGPSTMKKGMQAFMPKSQLPLMSRSNIMWASILAAMQGDRRHNWHHNLQGHLFSGDAQWANETSKYLIIAPLEGS